MGHPTIFWDFDGTLASRDGRWSGALIEALDEVAPGHGLERKDITPHLQTGFPWHEPHLPHPELRDPDAWWARLFGVLSGAFEAVGHGAASERLCRATRRVYTDPSTYFVYDDARAVLDDLSARGWRHVILSNHVPELGELVDGLALTESFDHVITSALIDHEKPHPETYRHALRIAGDPERAWMIGDNPIADVRGPEKAGIPGILVRRKHADVRRQSDDLHGALAWIGREDGLRRRTEAT